MKQNKLFVDESQSNVTQKILDLANLNLREDAEELAGILKKYFEKYAEKKADPGEATIATMEENEVEDFIANTIAGRIRSAASA